MDADTRKLHEKVQLLRKRRAVLSAQLLSSNATTNIHARIPSAKPSLQEQSPFTAAALEKASTSQKQLQENLYRLGAGATLFTVRDPDPTAVDDGRIIGVRVEVFVKRRFLQPYYVLLNRHPIDTERLRIHRHTIPPCIPLTALAAEHLPLPRASEKGPDTPQQDLGALVKALRRELMSYHMRLAKLQTVKSAIGSKKRSDLGVSNIAISPEAKEIRFETDDGLLCRILVDRSGSIERCVAVAADGRAREFEKQVETHGNVDGLGSLLAELLAPVG